MRPLSVILLLGYINFRTYGQSAVTPDAFTVTFEVASIKPVPPPPPGWGLPGAMSNGGPGTKDPSRWTAVNYSLSNLLMTAYGLKQSQYSGPDWLETERFQIIAKVPDGTTKEQFRVMLQTLLVERFHLKTHREKKEAQVYELVIGPKGPKFAESVPEPEGDGVPAAKSPSPTSSPTLDRYGFPELPPGRNSMMLVMNGRARARQVNAGMAHFAGMLAEQLGKPVVDATELKGNYDLSLTWSAGENSEGESGPSIFAAIQEQLGLKLEKKKSAVDVLVVDHMERVPTQN